MFKRDHKAPGGYEAPGRNSAEQSMPVSPSHESISEQEVADLAYRLWMERGCPMGSPEEDWYAAELELAGRKTVSELD